MNWSAVTLKCYEVYRKDPFDIPLHLFLFAVQEVFIHDYTVENGLGEKSVSEQRERLIASISGKTLNEGETREDQLLRRMQKEKDLNRKQELLQQLLAERKANQAKKGG